MFARPPTNLPGKQNITPPDRANSVDCPNCEERFKISKINDKKTRCPYCYEEIDLTNILRRPSIRRRRNTR